MKKSFFKNAIFLYTCTFLLLLPVIFFPFLSEGKSFIWSPDGLDQHYPALLYYGKLLRGILSGQNFPMIDFKIGLGFDTITTMNYYVLGDPISLLTVFMTPQNSVFFYGFLILVRLYLAGISFMALMKYFKKDGVAIVLGALIYVFCGYSLYAGLRHPFFINPMIYLPLILIGVEKVFRNHKPYLLIFMVFISTISNFYFFYDLTIITVIYVVFRYVTTYKKNYKNPFTGFLLTGLKTGGYYLLGTALSSFIFIPVIYAFSLNGRTGSSPQIMYGYLYYGGFYYLKILQGMFSGGVYPGYWTVSTFSGIVVVSFAILIANKKYWKLMWIYLMVLLGLFIPAFGYIMNGLAYTANRWCFVLSLLVATTFVFTYDNIWNLGKKESKILLISVGLYGILAFIFPSGLTVKVTFFMLFMIVFFILIFQNKSFKNKIKLKTNSLVKQKTFYNIIIYIFVFLSIGFNGYGLYSGHFFGYAGEFLSKEDVETRSSEGVLTLISDIQDNSFYRVETYGDKAVNEALTVGFHDVSAYYSLMDGEVTSYLTNLEVLNQKTAYRLENLDNRTILDSLASVKYLVTTKKSTAPFGYKLMKSVQSGTEEYYLFQNSYALPLGYTYENYMLKNDFEKLSALEKQKAMMNAVILDQSSDYATKFDNNASSGIKKLDVEIIPDSKVSLENHIIDVKEAGATITLKFSANPDSENYIRFNDLYINKKMKEIINFKVRGIGGATKQVNVRSPYYNSYFGKENYLVNLGYSADGIGKAVITFPETGTFSYSNIEAYSSSMDHYVSCIEALKNGSLKNIKYSGNVIQGDTDLKNKGLMVFSIPYSKGWSAYVDGVKCQVVQANVMYMALPLSPGTHHIILKYETPYLRVGIFVSFMALVILIGIVIYRKRKY